MHKHVLKIFDFVTISILRLMNTIYIWKHKDHYEESSKMKIPKGFYKN